jgi:hypothetical protein
MEDMTSTKWKDKMSPLTMRYSHTSGDLDAFRVAISDHLDTRGRHIWTTLVADDPDYLPPTHASCNAEETRVYAAVRAELKNTIFEEDGKIDTTLLWKRVNRQINHDAKAFVIQATMDVYPQMFTLVYEAFSDETRQAWNLFDKGKVYTVRKDFLKLWEWVSNPFSGTVGDLGARNAVLDCIKQVHRPMGNHSNIKMYTERQMSRYNTLNGTLFAYNNLVLERGGLQTMTIQHTKVEKMGMDLDNGEAVHDDATVTSVATAIDLRRLDNVPDPQTCPANLEFIETYLDICFRAYPHEVLGYFSKRLVHAGWTAGTADFEEELLEPRVDGRILHLPLAFPPDDEIQDDDPVSGPAYNLRSSVPIAVPQVAEARDSLPTSSAPAPAAVAAPTLRRRRVYPRSIALMPVFESTVESLQRARHARRSLIGYPPTFDMSLDMLKGIHAAALQDKSESDYWRHQGHFFTEFINKGALPGNPQLALDALGDTSVAI